MMAIDRCRHSYVSYMVVRSPSHQGDKYLFSGSYVVLSTKQLVHVQLVSNAYTGAHTHTHTNALFLSMSTSLFLSSFLWPLDPFLQLSSSPSFYWKPQQNSVRDASLRLKRRRKPKGVVLSFFDFIRSRKEEARDSTLGCFLATYQTAGGQMFSDVTVDLSARHKTTYFSLSKRIYIFICNPY